MGCGSTKQSEGKAEEKEQVEVLKKEEAKDRALKQLRVIFDSIDVDDNGRVSKGELQKALKDDQNLGDLIKQSVFNANYEELAGLDRDGDGHVSWEEFTECLTTQAVQEVQKEGHLKAVEKPAEVMVVELLKAVFESIDTNEDGAVSTDELRAKIDSDKDINGLPGGFGLLVEEAKFNTDFGLLENLDRDKNGVITWDEFEYHLKTPAKKELKETGEVQAAVQVEEEENGSCCICCPCSG